MIRLPDGRDVDLDGCDVCARPDCAAFRMQKGKRQQDMSDADLARLVIAREVCRNNAVDWREVARALAAENAAHIAARGQIGPLKARIAELNAMLDNAEKRTDIVADKVARAALDAAIHAVRSEQLYEPSNGEGDHGYQQAIRDAESAVRAVDIAAIIKEATK